MKLVESQFDKNDNSVQVLTTRKEVLEKSIDEQKVLSFYNLGKSHLCKIAGVSHSSLYAYLDGNSEPDTDNFAKVEQLYLIARELDLSGKGSIHHGFVDKPLPGEEKSLYQIQNCGLKTSKEVLS